jgi:hypothetical protein
MSANTSHGGTKPDLRSLAEWGFALSLAERTALRAVILNWPDAESALSAGYILPPLRAMATWGRK